MVVLLILQSLYFFLPAYFANMAPVLFKWIPFGGRPIAEKWLGSHKTWRGVIVGISVGVIIFWLQKVLYQQGFRSLAIIDYSDFSLLLGFLQGMGAMVGDLVKSYYKRKVGIKEGKPWIPWDQLDFVLGGLVFSFFVYVPEVEVAFFLLLLSPLLHVVVNYIGYMLGMKGNKW